ncbi:MAG: MBL fold metallo-hydrolase [Candidatus Omnitrophota bacterium]
MFLKKIIVGDLEENCYVLADEAARNAIIIDPGADYERICRVLKENRLKARLVVNTHGHADHIGADADFNLPVYIHKLDAKCLQDPQFNLSFLVGAPFSVKLKEIITVENGALIKLDSLALEVIHTPGHTPGGICLKMDDLVFTGDTLFFGGVGRTDFPGASEQQLLASIRDRLLSLDDTTIIYPGHGPNSTIGNEKHRNPFLSNA